MIKPSDVKTKSLFYSRKNETVANYNQVALDVGYSSVKGFGPRTAFCFPSFAKKVNANGLLTIGTPSPDDIMYKDLSTNEMWVVGKLANDLISANDSSASETELYGRNRYFSPQFVIPSKVGIAFALIGSTIPDCPIHLQTGLPPKYLGDENLLKEALAGHHDFAIKRGNNPWMEFHFDLDIENIEVMPQPKGTLFSLIYDNAGHKAVNADKILGSKILIVDGGFGTFDLFNIKQIELDGDETFPELGMKQVLQETANEIKKKYGIEIPIPVLQQNLKTGTFVNYDRVAKTSKDEPFDEILDKASDHVCSEAIKKICSLYSDLIYHNYLVITGGTGEAWFDKISEEFAGLQTLKCIKGTQNDSLPSIFSNVRGYYMFQLNLLRRKK